MKSASSQLATHIGGETTTLATCWKVTRRDGSIFGFTDFDKDLTVESLVYIARSGYTRSAIHTIANLAVDNLDIESAIDSETLSAAEVHRIEGIVVYFGGLVLLYELTQRRDGRSPGGGAA